MSTKNAKVASMSVIATMIAAVGAQKVQLDTAIQAAAVECIGQSIVHRNITPMKDLYATCEKSVRRDALLAFFEKFGHAMWLKPNAALGRKSSEIGFFDAGKSWTKEYREQVEAYNWFDAKKEQAPVSIYDAETIIGKTMKQLDKLASDVGVTLNNKELYLKVKAAYASAIAGLLTKEIDATAHTAPLTKNEERVNLIATDTSNGQHDVNRGTSPSDAKLKDLAAHFNGTAPVAAVG